MAEVRAAAKADRNRLAAMLARAFNDDPVMCWADPNDQTRPKRAERMFGRQLDRLLPFGEVHTATGLDAGALWAPPGEWEWPPLAGLQLLLGAGLRAVPRLVRGFGQIEHAHPREPHYYLAVLGTDPSAQGKGLGSAVMQPVLEMCDRDGIGAYLESSKERNIDFYLRHGFRVTRSIDLLDGPRVWFMWREPRGTAPSPGV